MKTLVEQIDWAKGDGLIPAVVQSERTLQVLMLGYMNQEALEATLSTGKVTFYSRTKGRLWQKGETSQNHLSLVDIELDCDRDTLLVWATPQGPTCHLNTTSCFGEVTAPGVGFLGHLEDVIRQRDAQRPEGSYTTKLFEAGVDRIAQKVGEEAVETVIAAKNDAREPLVNEVSDLLYHLLVLLRHKDVDLKEITAALRARHGA